VRKYRELASLGFVEPGSCAGDLDATQAEDWLGRWAMNLMLINVSTRKLRRAVRLPEGDLPVIAGDGTSKSAASRRFVALSAERLAAWMASDLSKLDLLIIQIDGLHIGNDLVLVAALGIDGNGDKHPLGLVEGATENAAVVQALVDNCIRRSRRTIPATARSALPTSQKTACKRLGLHQIFTRPYTPKINGKAERVIQTALRR
jgi:putative transposase